MGFSGAGQPLAALLWACSRVGALERLLCVSLGVGSSRTLVGAEATVAAGSRVTPKRCWPGALPSSHAAASVFSPVNGARCHLP